MTETTVFQTDFTHGQVAIPGHDNIRVPRDPTGDFTVEYLDNTTQPHLAGADGNTIYMAPESTMRSVDTAKYPFTERLPDSERDLYLAPDVPIVEHWFKRYGKQWWTLWKALVLPAGSYRFSVEVYPDIYIGAHHWAPDPLSGEYRVVVHGQDAPVFLNDHFGQWVVLSVELNHPGGLFKHGVEFRARWGIETVGLFIRRWKVLRLDAAPTPTPLPQPGTLSAFVAAQEQLVANLKTVHDGIHLAETHAADVLEMARKMLEATK